MLLVYKVVPFALLRSFALNLYDQAQGMLASGLVLQLLGSLLSASGLSLLTFGSFYLFLCKNNNIEYIIKHDMSMIGKLNKFN